MIDDAVACTITPHLTHFCRHPIEYPHKKAYRRSLRGELDKSCNTLSEHLDASAGVPLPRFAKDRVMADTVSGGAPPRFRLGGGRVFDITWLPAQIAQQVRALARRDDPIWREVAATVVMCGGGAAIPGVAEEVAHRLGDRDRQNDSDEEDVVMEEPFDIPCDVRVSDDPSFAALKGASIFAARPDFCVRAVSRDEFTKGGARAISMKCMQ